MTFSQAFSNAISVYHSIFDGRASRSAYWWPVLGVFLGYILLFAVVGGMIPFANSNGELSIVPIGSMVLLIVVYFALFIYVTVMSIPLFVLTGRRLHDTSRSAWWMLVTLVPFFGPIVLMVFMALRGTKGPNRFGNDPLDPDADGGGYGGEGLTASSIPSVPRD